MTKIKSKFGISRSGWINEVLTEEYRQELRNIVNEDVFITAMDGIASRYKSRREMEVQAPNAKQIEAALEVIACEAQTLKNHLFSLDPSSKILLTDSLYKFGKNRDFLVSLQGELSMLELIANNALSNMDSNTFRKSKGSRLSLAAETKNLLERYGVPATNYNDGPWCKCIEIILDVCGEKTSEARNTIRAFLG